MLGHHDTFRLRHGPSVRTFSDVEVTKTGDGRYELTGTEHKVEVAPGRGLEVRDVVVTVGFLEEHVIPEE
jgi:hypothetical protein